MSKDIKENITVQEAFEKYQRYNELRNLSIYTIEHKVVNLTFHNFEIYKQNQCKITVGKMQDIPNAGKAEYKN